jgi:hypothetical protein
MHIKCKSIFQNKLNLLTLEVVKLNEKEKVEQQEADDEEE